MLLSNFLGLSEKYSAYDKARVAVLPVPYEATVSYGRGTAKGPSAIIAASSQVEFYDEELGCEPYEAGIATLEPLMVAGLAPAAMRGRVVPAVKKIISDGKLPFVLGGEHSITPAVVLAVHAVHGHVTVVQFDAHADLRQEYEGEPMSHACAMARVRDICPVVHLGIRNISKEEAKLASREKFPIFYAKDMHRSDDWMEEAIKAIGTEKVYATIDVDAFDSSVMPATGTPEPGGLGWYQVVDFLRLLCRRKRVVGFDVVELAPLDGMRACDFLAAKLAYKCIGYWQTGINC
ncbi:MAG: agmatinase [Pseudomonadota bacterium]